MHKDTSEPQNSSPVADMPQQNDPAAQAAPAQPKEKKAAPKGKGGIKRFFGAIGGFFKKHKVLGVLLIVVILILALVLRGCAAVSAAAKQASSYSFVRTTTLTKGDLTSTVSCTGTVESSDTSTVTYASAGTAALPKFKTVNVAVGDTVQAGDVIATLDTADIEQSIQKEKENIADQVTKAQTSYNRAVTSYNDTVDKYNTQKTEVANLLTILQQTRDALNTAKTQVATYQAAYDSADSDMKTKLDALNTANSALQSALTAYNTANGTTFSLTLDTNGDGWYNESSITDSAAQTALATQISNLTNAKTAYTNAATAYKAASDNLSTAKQTTNYETLVQSESQADSKYESAKSQLDSLQSQIDSAKNTVDDAKSTLDKASESDTLDTLNDQLADCSLKAETSGKITSLNASVGSTPSGTIATIQDVDHLKVSVTVAEADINSIETGMSCQITTDATEGTIQGTLTQIDPVAGDSAKFGAEVTVDDANTALKIGMNATVKIILSNTADCYTVPLDAIGNDDDGKGDYVYRSTGGMGVDMTFEKVYVTTGDSNDYYTEISSDDLADGDIIRSSSDLTQGIVDTAASENYMEQMTVSDGGDQGGPDGGQGGPDGGGAAAAPAAPAGGQ